MLLALLTLPFILVAIATWHSLSPLLVTAGVLAGLVIDPDLDMLAFTASKMRILRIPLLGPLLGAVWVAYWIPYALVFKHRGISHVPILGTLTRLAYLLPLYLLLGRLGFTITNSHAIMLGCGLCLADFGHWLRDFHGLCV